MNVNTLKEKLKQNDQLQLIDIREPYEYEDGHISNINIPLCQVMEKIDQFDTSKEIILYCNSGKRSKALKYILCKKFDLKKIDHLEGGYQKWLDQNF
jgi:rhodanese-related sulfurtransferase